MKPLVMSESFEKFLVDWNKEAGLSTPEHHIRIARFLQGVCESKSRRGLLLAFRGSGKSTVVGLFLCWILYRNPNMRIIVISADTTLSKKMVRFAKRIIETHPSLESLRPAKKTEWAAGCLTVAREAQLRDPSILAAGLGSNITGSRADAVICDDVEVPKTANSALKREELREKLLELEFVLTPGGMQIFVGTPHSSDTIYKT